MHENIKFIGAKIWKVRKE